MRTKARDPILAASRAPTQGVFGPRARTAIAYFAQVLSGD
jgi:hypothetical protein